MFGLFKKKPRTLLDDLVETVYGDNAKKTADLAEAIALARDQLLGGACDGKEVVSVATRLNDSPFPYSTHDLATFVALHILRETPAEQRKELMLIQLKARMTVLSWTQEGKVVKPLLQAFENTLYEKYNPGNFR
jgi:hypothetical protein